MKWAVDPEIAFLLGRYSLHESFFYAHAVIVAIYFLCSFCRHRMLDLNDGILLKIDFTEFPWNETFPRCDKFYVLWTYAVCLSDMNFVLNCFVLLWIYHHLVYSSYELFTNALQSCLTSTEVSYGVRSG